MSKTQTDEDECNHGYNCDINAMCTNIEGGFACKCNEGWFGDGVNCTGILHSFNFYIHESTQSVNKTLMEIHFLLKQ